MPKLDDTLSGIPAIELATVAVCADRETAVEVQAAYDEEAGYPRTATRTLAGTPIPDGAPRQTLHAHDVSAILAEDGVTPTGWTHPMPRAALKEELAARVEAKSVAEIATMRSAASAKLPTERLG
jgi:hypothetical protein